ncbi:cell division ATP-binding protein FtsE [Subtercola sp. PAMC28395]|uniref:cell division ATP-binding protein FtsE n=1 Tax=Subtercola sp. PAMC28395 TaxID=2846775 RepID=UPI001C0B48FD|nr:cell division ATP-binding protein FtsE [Subtercola sp. PAMC28395]QWT23648.1 cell division ATP-binding protein FtsE [Subtercola sp. PAMC28395]
MIRFDQVSKMYKGTAKPALNTIDLEILRGEFVFLVGASGSGKSSFLRLVLKEDRPSSGSIHVLGQDLGSISSRKVPYFRRNLGVVFQDFRLLPNKNVFDNVAFTLQVIGKSRGFIQEAVPDVLAMVGLAEKAGRLPHELSGGEQQRVAIARAVVNKPAILLADEPTGNLDPVTSAGIMNVLDRINAGGTTIIMATHDNAIVDQMQRRVVELVSGQVVRDERQGGYGKITEISLQDSGMTAEITRPDPLSLRMQATGAIDRPVMPLVAPAPVASLSTAADARAAAPAATTSMPAAASTSAATSTSAAASTSATTSAPATTSMPAAAVPAFIGGVTATPVPSATPSRAVPVVPRVPVVSASTISPSPGHPAAEDPASRSGGVDDPSSDAHGGESPEPDSAVSGTAPEDDLATASLSLAEKLGLRAPGDRHDPTADQKVGPTS